MKSLLIACLLGFGVYYDSFAQGTIAFNNFSATPGRVWYGNPFAGTNGAVLATAGYHVELMFAPIGGTNFSGARIFTSATGGGQFFDGSTVILAGITAGTGNADVNNVQIFLRGWTGAFADYNSALAGANIGAAAVGQTAIFLNPTGGSGTALPANMVGWLASNPLVIGVPEPSAISMAGLGALLWLGFGRRGRCDGPVHH